MHEQMHVHAGCSFDYRLPAPGGILPEERRTARLFRSRLPELILANLGNVARSFDRKYSKGELHVTSSLRTGAVVVAALAAALALTACGSDDDAGKDSGADPAASATPGGGDSSEESKGGGTDSAALEGTWVGLTDGKNVTVSVAARKVALVADQSVCQGDVKDMGGEPMLALTCTGGSTDRTMGAIDSVDGSKLVVSWDGGTKDTLTKAEPGKLPSGMPSLPDLSDLPEVPAP